jgi:hypothetical protein
MIHRPHATCVNDRTADASYASSSFIHSHGDRGSGVASLISRYALALAASLPLMFTGCSDGSSSASSASAADSGNTAVADTTSNANGPVATTPATSTTTSSSSSSTVTAPANGSSAPALPINAKPAIAGAPGTTVLVGNAYTFTPMASDADGDKLTYSIANKPAWSTFNPATGVLAGKPTAADVGTYSNIGISVSDGKAQTSLAKFALSVVAVANGNMTISWTPPIQNTDGSTISSLAGYKIYYGTSEDSLTKVALVSNPSLTRYVIENLVPATYYVSVVSIGQGGVESRRSGIVATTIS